MTNAMPVLSKVEFHFVERSEHSDEGFYFSYKCRIDDKQYGLVFTLDPGTVFNLDKQLEMVDQSMGYIQSLMRAIQEHGHREVNYEDYK